MDVVNPLNYAPAAPLAHPWIRLAYRLVILAGAIAVLCLWGPPACRWAQFLYWQHRCMTYAPARDHPVFRCDLTTHQIFYSELNPLRGRFENFGDSPSRWTLPTIFLHEMKRPDGSPRLVSLSADRFCLSDITSGYSLRLDAQQWIPAEFPARPQPAGPQRQAMLDIPRDAKRLNLLAGRVDPVNPSHFTFDYELDNRRHTVDAWLNDADELLVCARP